MSLTLESGIENVVLYSHKDTGERYGVPWDGVVSISAEGGQGTHTNVYYDAAKISQHPQSGEYQGKISAYSYPLEFYAHDGYTEPLPGLYLDEQYPTRFSLTYKTNFGRNGDYKLHILYNLLALPDSKSYTSLSSTPSPMVNTWALTGVPEVPKKYRPTSHVVVDSRLLKESTLRELEAILFGSDENQPELPDLQFLIDNVLYQTFVLTDITTDAWTLIGPDHLMKVDDEGVFTVDGIRVIFHDDDTYTIIDDYEE